MASASIPELLRAQKEFFQTGATFPLDFRLAQLARLRDAIREGEQKLFEALRADMRRASFETFVAEVGFLYQDISHTMKHVGRWMRPRSAPTPLVHFHARSKIHPVPKGQVLIIGPWNYPVQLTLAPLAGALAAGCTAIVKPSEISAHASAALAEILGKAFDPKIVAVVEGGVDVNQALLAQRFDHIFFTGSTAVGRIVMEAAAKHLTPVTLELGGKSPCLVDSTADLEVAARRIVWGKFFNAGQTCVAPDYLLVQKKVRDPLLERIKGAIHDFYGEDPRRSPDFPRIISQRHFARLKDLLRDGTLVCGGQFDEGELYIAPTVMKDITLGHRVMSDEIFGPLLPVLDYGTLEEAISVIRQRANPLALYLFTRDRATEERVIREVPFGGGCVNDTMIHLSCPDLPFGGTGESGIGAYHGEHGFETFSHFKGVVWKSFFPDVRLRYPAYDEKKLGLARWFMK